jgi:hypothetical protein
MLNIIGKWFKAGDAYAGQILEELTPLVYRIQLYNMPRFTKKAQSNVTVSQMLTWDFYSTQRDFRMACSAKYDDQPTPADTEWEHPQT